MESATQPAKSNRRIHFNSILWFICLAICISSAMLWVHSYYLRLTVRLLVDDMQSSVVLDRGIIQVHRDVIPGHTFTTARFGRWDFSDESGGNDISGSSPPPNAVLGFGRYELAITGPGLVKLTSLTLAMPIWFVVLVSGLLALVPSMLELRRRRRIARGACAHCGYDLTGNATGVCPECGQSTSSSAGA